MSGVNELDPRLSRLLAITKQLDERKRLYEEYDRLVLELYNEGFDYTVVDDLVVELVDRFAAGNTAFTSAAVKRFELHIEPKARAEKRASREAKRKTGGGK